MNLYLNCCVSSLITHELIREQIFLLGSACLLNDPKTKAQAWLVYKQININKLFIELSLSCSLSPLFIYSPSTTSFRLIECTIGSIIQSIE